MTDREKLDEIIDVAGPVSDEEFARILAETPEEEGDDETISRIVAAETEPGDVVSHGELKRRRGL